MIQEIQDILRRKRDQNIECTEAEAAKLKQFLIEVDVVDDAGQPIERNVELYDAVHEYFPTQYEQVMDELQGKKPKTL